MWNGDALLYEIRALGHTGVGAAMERDTGLALPADGGKITGRVAYTNGPGIDRPLNFIRMNFSAGWNGLEAIYPHRDWRGQIDRLSFVDGTFQRCKGEPGPPATWGGTLGDCLGAPTPASSLSMIYGGANRIAATWVGGQLDNMRDASGKLYMRNRFYDPLTGQFTQEDPIGLAGGVNLYGFAGGDPATYADPFGLCPQSAGGDGETETYSDCPAGTTGWYANRLSNGEGNTALNWIGGSFAACGESWACQGVLTVASLGSAAAVPAVGRGAAALPTAGRGATARMAAVRAAGTEGEAAVAAATGLARNRTVRLGSRVPDFVEDGARVYHESKNVRILSNTRQLREMAAHVPEGGRLVIHVRQTTLVRGSFNPLTNPAVRAVRIVRTIP